MQSTQNINGTVTEFKRGSWAFPICTFIILLVCLFEIQREIKHFNMLERLSENGITTKAIITVKDVIIRKAFDTYFFQYRYQVNNDLIVSNSVVKKNVYKSKNKGEAIVITYNRLNPLESSYGNLLNVSKNEIFKYNWFYYSSLGVSAIVLLVITVSMSLNGIRQSQTNR